MHEQKSILYTSRTECPQYVKNGDGCSFNKLIYMYECEW